MVVEIAALVKSFADYKEGHDKKIQEMQAKIDKQSDLIMKQQMFLENIDRKERENNIVVLGVPEETEELEGATDDNAKLGKIWTKMGTNVTRVSHKRLGRNVQPGRKRPILVTVRSKENRDEALEKSKKLKESGASYERIYVKKDLHPEVRKEWNRLREAERNEKSKPGNVGHIIRFDSKERKLYRNNIVIDSWTPHSF